MILPGNFLWKQLDGPQIRAMSDALLAYGKSIFDSTLDYINTLSIETANDSHLILLGVLSGFTRPIIQVPDTTYFYFTEDAEHDAENGFANIEVPKSGGRLSSGVIENKTYSNYIGTEYYRALLKEFIRGQGELGGLELLDDICYALSKYDIPSQQPFYEFEFYEYGNVPTGRAPGDLNIDMGTMSQWKNPEVIYAILVGLAKSIYAPIPQLFVSISTEEEDNG